MIILKSQSEIDCIREASRLTAETLEMLIAEVKPGVMTIELDSMADEFIRSRGGVPGTKGYHGYPASICASVNEEVVHGIPGKRRLKSGDIISLDLVVRMNGFFGDSAVTVPVGQIKPEIRELLKVTEDSLFEGIGMAVAGNRLGDISNAVQVCAESHGYGVVRDFVGHGIGRDMHEDPQIPNFGLPGHGPLLKPGMVLCIEPMINMGTPRVRVLEDDWTAVTTDRKPSAHFEHTVVVTENGPEILTARSVPRLMS